jgi:hypothetical protein
MSDAKATIKRMLTQLMKTQELELDCEEVFDVLDLYAEAAARGEDPKDILPKVKQHLELCPCCEEELEAMLRVLEAGES